MPSQNKKGDGHSSECDPLLAVPPPGSAVAKAEAPRRYSIIDIDTATVGCGERAEGGEGDESRPLLLSEETRHRGRLVLLVPAADGTAEEARGPGGSAEGEGIGESTGGLRGCFDGGEIGGLVLENSGSTARDHLANERTYLAWMRTALALLGASLALLKWDAAADVEGYLVGVLGVAVLAASTRRYHRNMRLLMGDGSGSGGPFEPNTTSASLVSAFVAVLFVVVFVLDHRAKRGRTAQ